MPRHVPSFSFIAQTGCSNRVLELKERMKKDDNKALIIGVFPTNSFMSANNCIGNIRHKPA